MALVGAKSELHLARRSNFLVSIFSRLHNWRNTYKSRPGLLSSTIGLITTLVNVYTTQRGSWSITYVMTAAATATTTFVTLIMYLLYAAWTEPYWKEHCKLNGWQVVQ
jgi:hypothetical protein